MATKTITLTGAVYLLGTGSALIQSDDYVESPIKSSTASGGSAVDDVARAAVSTHAGNADMVRTTPLFRAPMCITALQTPGTKLLPTN